MPASPTQDLEFFLSKKKRLEAAGRLRWFHWVIILTSLAVTLFAWTMARNTNQQQIDERFDREAHQVIELISERMTRYEDALWGGVAALSTEDKVLTETAWRNYSDSLKIRDKYPGVNGIGVIDYVKPEAIGGYLRQSQELRPDFRVFPEHDQNEYWPITFIEPLSENMAALGLDIAHETNRLTAAKKARDTGTAQITGPITLVQDARKTPGFLFYAPHYASPNLATQTERRENFVNLVYAPFVFERLMIGTLEMDRRLIRLRISDEGVNLFDEVGTVEADSRAEPLRKTQITKQIYGRSWVFDIESNEAFELSTKNYKPLMVLLSGLGVEALIIALFIMLARANRRAVRFAGEMAQAYEKKSNLLGNILNNAIDGVVLSDASGRIRDFNKACEAMFGYEAEEVIGKHLDVLFRSLKKDFIALNNVVAVDPTPQMIKDFYTGQMREVTGRRKDGSDIMLEISTTEIVERGEVMYNTIARDVTRRKTAEAKLQKTMQDLVHSNQDLEGFAYVASHDLKSPLRAIDNLSQWIAEDMDPEGDKENRSRVMLLRARVARMEELLNSLLSYSRAGKVFDQTKRINAGALLRDIKSVQNVSDAFQIMIAPELDSLEIPRMPLEQIFHNLISNAVKHHDRPDGSVSVTGAETAEAYTFRISDDGPGIDPKFHSKVFDMFQTLRPRDEVEGSGMGLALVKKMLDRHGGGIELESSTGKGSTFSITFPKAVPWEYLGQNTAIA